MDAFNIWRNECMVKVKGTPYLTLEVSLLSRKYSHMMRSFYPLFPSVLGFKGSCLKLHWTEQNISSFLTSWCSSLAPWPPNYPTSRPFCHLTGTTKDELSGLMSDRDNWKVVVARSTMSARWEEERKEVEGIQRSNSGPYASRPRTNRLCHPYSNSAKVQGVK